MSSAILPPNYSFRGKKKLFLTKNSNDFSNSDKFFFLFQNFRAATAWSSGAINGRPHSCLKTQSHGRWHNYRRRQMNSLFSFSSGKCSPPVFSIQPCFRTFATGRMYINRYKPSSVPKGSDEMELARTTNWFHFQMAVEKHENWSESWVEKTKKEGYCRALIYRYFSRPLDGNCNDSLLLFT